MAIGISGGIDPDGPNCSARGMSWPSATVIVKAIW
jgi:hypothetical protein